MVGVAVHVGGTLGVEVHVDVGVLVGVSVLEEETVGEAVGV